MPPSRQKKHPRSIYFIGCEADTEIIGVMDQCTGLRIRVHSPQPKASSKQKHLDIQGPLIILEAGTAPLYCDIYDRMAGEQFADAADALEKMNRIKTELARNDARFEKLPRIVHALKSGKFVRDDRNDPK